jgi:hypothetical protein
VERLYVAWSGDRLETSPLVKEDVLRRFSRPELARQLAAVLNVAYYESRQGTL